MKKVHMDSADSLLQSLDANTIQQLESALLLLQQNRSGAELRAQLFNALLDQYHVPKDHTLRQESAPVRLDCPTLVHRIESFGFSKGLAQH